MPIIVSACSLIKVKMISFEILWLLLQIKIKRADCVQWPKIPLRVQNTLFNMNTSKQNETNQRIEAKRKIEAVAKIKIQIISYYNYM